jgi:ankyrin repeat protein
MSGDDMTLDEFLTYLADEPGWSGVGRIGIASRDIEGDTPLHAALWARDDEAARALVDSGADINATGDMGYTPLHVAVAQTNAVLAAYLSERGASWDTPNEFGFTPRTNAMASEDVAITTLVKDHPSEG